MRRFLFSAVMFLFVASCFAGSLKQMMLNDFAFIGNTFKSMYAPQEWKKRHAGWDIDVEIAKIRDEIIARENITVRDYQDLVRQFIISTRDFHVGVSFIRTEKAGLHFDVMRVGEKYFIVEIDRNKLPAATFPFNPGDELVTFDGKPTHEVVNSLRPYLPNSNEISNWAISTYLLTIRPASMGMPVPRGPITLGIKRKGCDKVYTYQMIWEYRPEIMTDYRLPKGFANKGRRGQNLFSNLENDANMLFPYVKDLDVNRGKSPFSLGAKKSFIPNLGRKIWETDDGFYAYMFLADNNKVIGFVRIPSYSPAAPTAEQVKKFAKIIKKFKQFTDGMIIDQINNPGGSAFYLYALASTLTDQALFAPKERMTLDPGRISWAHEALKELKTVKTDADAKKIIGPTLSGYPTSYQTAKFYEEYCRFIIAEWEAGRQLTTPYYLYGVDQVNPHPEVQYTKPILLLINELDISGGDFFPAIMQDNKRVTTLGTNTAGAGGYVITVEYPNLFGVSHFSYTGSIAKRIDSNPIENLGVRADIQYQLTENDMQNNFVDYKNAILKAMNGLLQ